MTDAAFALGRIDPGAFLGDIGGAGEAAREAIRRDIAGPLDADVREAAAGILSVAEADTARALRVVSVERGHDPRDLALVAFGGAGPLIASAVAAELSVPEVVVPRAAGVLSALGLLVSDLSYDESVSRVRPWSAVDVGDLETAFADLEARGRERLADVPAERRRLERALDMRYRGQTYDLTVEVPDELDAESLSTVADRFHEAHRQRYGHASPDEPLELVTVRLRARGVVDPPELEPTTTAGSVADAVREERPVTFDERTRDVRVYDRSRLPTGERFGGPAIVAGSESTLVVRPPDRVRVADDGSLVVEVDADA